MSESLTNGSVSTCSEDNEIKSEPNTNEKVDIDLSHSSKMNSSGDSGKNTSSSSCVASSIDEPVSGIESDICKSEDARGKSETITSDFEGDSNIDATIDDNSNDATFMTEEQKIMAAEEKAAEKKNTSYEEKKKAEMLAREQEDQELRQQRHKRLMHLLQKSEFYSQFLLEKIDSQLNDESAKQAKKKKAEKDSPGKENSDGRISFSPLKFYCICLNIEVHVV